MKKKILHVQGYWSNEKIKKIPNIKGIYFVYKARRDYDKNCKVKELIFVGSGDEIRTEIENLIEDKTFQEMILLGNKLLFSYTAVLDPNALKNLTKKLVYQLRPLLNSNIDCSFVDEYPKNEIIFLGDNKLLDNKPSIKYSYN